MLRSFRLAATLSLLSVIFPLSAAAQTPIALPYTMTTYAGLTPISPAAAGTQCPNLPTGVKSTDAYGDGCLAVNGIFGAAAYGGVQVDLSGNIYVVDDTSATPVIHKINPATGIMTMVAGGGTACSGKQDSTGDGCLATATALVNNRSAGIDYYGNILLGGYSDHFVHMICLNASPLCGGTVSATTPIEIPIGNMGLVAGCAPSTTGNGTSSGTLPLGPLGAENTPGFSYKTYSVSAFQNGGTCTTSLGEEYKPEGITGDVYGNIYYADSGVSRWRVVLGPALYNGVTNPLYVVLAKNAAWTTVTAGYVYTISGYPGTTVTSLGGSCNGGGTATDTYGDGCLFTSSYSMGLAGYPSGMGVDAAGNMIYTDETRGLRVFYVSDGTNFTSGTPGYIAGQKMKNAIIANIKGYTAWASVTAPPTGFNYMLAGGGSTAIGTATPATLGSALSFTADNKMYKLAVSPQGNIYIGDSGGPARVYFYDINTGYLRTLFVGSANVTAGNYCSGTSGPKSLSAYSDGCPASKSLFSNGNSMSVGVDPQGNLYMYDGTEPVIRKVLAQGFTPQTYNTTPTAITQTFQVHLPESATGTVTGATATVTSSPDITAAPTTPSCSQSSGDNTVDCTVSVTTTPSAVGQRSAALTVTLPTGGWQNASATIGLYEAVSGSVMVVDNATLSGAIPLTKNSIFSSITPAAVAVDGAGNVYAASGTSIHEAFNGSSWTYSTLPNSLSATPSQIAVDPTGNIFAVNSSTPTITELQLIAAGAPATYTTTSVSYTPSSGTATPQAIATDQFGNLYAADYQSGGSSVYRLSWSPLTQTYQNQVTVASGLVNVVSLAVDPSGNVFVADNNAGKVYEYAPASAAAYSLANTYTVASPDALAVDAGGNLYAQTGSTVIEIPVSGGLSPVTVLSSLSTPVGLAVDGLGNVYSADASASSITQVVRNAVTCNFGTEIAVGPPTCSGTVTNAGNLATTGSVNPSYFTLSGCGGSGNMIEPLSAGEACALSAVMAGTATTPITFLPAASTLGSFTLEGVLNLPQYNTTTSIAGLTPSSPYYALSGTEATFTVTVSPVSYSGSNVPTKMPTVWVCQGSIVCASNSAYATFTPTGPLTQVGSTNSGSTTVNVSGLSAGTYNINASYPGEGFTALILESSATSSGTSFTLGQVSTAVNSWTPGATTQQVSAVIGASVLNATATPSVAGNFVYTATCTSGNCTQYSNTTIDAATYLPIGTYTLGVSFVPTDLTDYIPSSPAVTVSGYTVTQGTTTAAVGASTNVVASDGSGNYTSLSAALATLQPTGGTIYLKPGTYTGQNAISYPNVYLRGLGGDPTKILLTGANGNFSVGSYPQSSGIAFGPGPALKGGDEGSAVLDVSKNGYMGTTNLSTTTSPAGFYAEYLTIQNTYDTDPVTTSTTTAGGNGGSCDFSKTTPHTLQYLFNNGLSCGSQALALWLNADQGILNNVNLISQQDTFYAGYQGTSGSTNVPARQYVWKGTITGNVDYIFGDAALVMDHTNIFTTWNGLAANGEATITAQNKRVPTTGGAGDYLSGYVCNACTLMSQSTGMTKLYYGRPWGVYSTFVLLNSQVDQVNPAGWIGWDNASEYLATSTYAEYNTQAYIDPAVGTAPYPSILIYPTTAAGGIIPTGGNSGYGATASSTPPVALESSAAQLTAAQAVPYYPLNFLSTTVSTTGGYSGMPATWNPMTAIASAVNSFAPTASVGSVGFGSSVTILGRPQTPGAGVVPTGSYAFYDNLNTNAACSAAAGNCTRIASGTLDASGEAYLTTNTLVKGTHYFTMVYGGDTNFTASTTATPYAITVVATVVNTITTLSVNNPNITYGGTITGTATVTPASGSSFAFGTVTLLSGSTTLSSCTLNGTSNTCSFSLPNLAAGGVQTMTASFGGGPSQDGNETFNSSTSSGVYFTVNQAVLHLTASNASVLAGGAMPTFAYTVTGYVNGDTGTVLSGAPTITTAAANTATIGEFPISITTGTLAAGNYNFTFTGGYLYVTGTSQAAAVATGDSRTVTEPAFPAVCQQLTAAITQVNDDIPASVDATVTNPDGARIQAALNSCSASYPGTGQGLAVQLSVDAAGHSAFLTGPLSMPSNVTLLVDPGVVLFFSRNAQDYDKVAGTHTCGTISQASATSSCKPLVDIPGASTNVGVMGYGKLDGRGGDTLLNTVNNAYAGYSWWGLSAAYASPDSQQNPRWIQMESGSSNITLYKITLRNAPLFHITTGGAVNNFTAWDIKIVTPTSSRNTDGIDPGNMINGTITRSWISDGDDDVAVGGAGTTAPARNISVTNNHLFAGHGQSIGSYTGAGVSNILFDGNMAAGNAFAGMGAAGLTASDTNSTGIRIKSENDRGGLVTNIQYSNECLLDHKSDIQFTPLYGTNPGTLTPNFTNILMQNLVFMNDSASSSAGTVQFTGAVNGTIINPLQVTLDNVTFPSALSSSSFTTTGTAGTETYAQLTYGPGEVSSNFIAAWATFAGSNGDTVTNNITATSLYPPACSFTYIVPELTGPVGLPQTITAGQTATAVVILTPAVGGAPYPTGPVTLTDALTSNTYTATLPGTTDTINIPLSGLSVGTHTFTATYAGDSNYKLVNGQTAYSTAGPYDVTVNAGTLPSTTTTLSGVPSNIIFGASFTATVTVTGSSPTGTVQLIVNGASSTAPIALSAGTASATFTLPYSSAAYAIYAVYSGDAANAGSYSTTSSVTVGSAATTTTLSANSTHTTLGHPLTVNATVTSAAGTPIGTVSFSYTTTSNSTATSLITTALSNGIASASFNLPDGTDYVTATYNPGVGSYTTSASAAMTFTVSLPTPTALPTAPFALPYTMTTIAGGGAAVPSSGNMVCTGATDKFGDGCLASAIALSASDDLRGITADPFGNVYYTDSVANLVHRIAPNGIVTNFAGRVTGTACVPTVTAGCTPTLVSLSNPRGVNSDTMGNIFISGYNQNKVYKVSVTDGLMYLVAGNGTAGTPTGSNGDGGAATSANLTGPRAAWVDAVGDIYISDTGAYKIRMVDLTGNIQTVAGTGATVSGSYVDSGDGGPATAATLSVSQGLVTDANLNLYISTTNRIRVVCVTCGTNSPLDTLLTTLGIPSPVNGYIYTIAGGGSAGFSGTSPVLATSVSLSPQKLALDTNGNIFFADAGKGASSPYGAVYMLDLHTGYLHLIAGNAASNCAGSDSYGDGCPATQAMIGNNGNGIGVTVDPLGNIYVTDAKNQLLRKVATNLASPSTAVNATTSQPVLIHFTPGDTKASSNALVYPSSEWTLGTPACTSNADTTADCLLTSAFKPMVPGLRSTPLTINSALSNTAILALTGIGSGAGATLDPASQISFGKNLSVAGLATDNAGNVYVSDANSRNILRFAASTLTQGSSATSTTLATLTAPGAVAVDPRGYVYAADTSTGLITQITPAGTVSTLPFTFTAPAGLAVDALNKLYVSDSSTAAVYQIDPITVEERKLSAGTLITPMGLSIDPSGNLLIADSSAPALYRLTSSGTLSTVSTTASAPSAVVTDAAGNLLIADTSAILAVPASSHSSAFTVASLTPSALAIDSAGNLYTGSGGGVLKLIRTQAYVQYAGPSSPSQAVKMLESGNLALTLSSLSQTDASDYSLTATASTDCTLSGGLPSALAIGGVCAMTASYTPTTYVTTTDTVTLNGNPQNAALSTPSSIQLTLTAPATAPASVTVLQATPSSPVYGQTITLKSITTPSVSMPLVPAGSVTFYIDSSTQLTGTVDPATGIATVSAPVLNAGNHQFYSTYTSSNGYTTSTSSTVNLNIGQAAPSITWATPAAITYGTALSGTQLNATATGATGATLPGVFTYSPLSGAVLTAGSQTLSVSFAPTDITNYTTPAIKTVQLQVNKAASSVLLTSSLNPVLLQTQVTYTATVSSTAGKPTGTVTFQDGGVALTACTGVPVTTATGLASCAVTYTVTGTHSITVLYNGDTNFLSAGPSNTVSEAATDINIGSPTVGGNTTSSETILPGGAAVFSFPIAPSSGTTFPSPVTFTVSSSPALPSGTTMTLTPSAWVYTSNNPWSWTLPANTSLTSNTVLTIQLPQTTTSAQPAGGNLALHLAPFSLALLLLPFAGRLRKSGKRLGRMLAIVLLAGAGAATLAGLSGCGSNTGFFAQAPQSYTVTVTVGYGSLSHTSNVTVTVE